MRNFLCPLCFLMAGILPLFGQSDSPGKNRESAGRTAWFACLAIPEGLENPAKILAVDKITELELSPFMASAAVKIPADGILRIVRVVSDPADPKKTKYIILAEAKIPETVDEALIILGPLPQPKSDLLFQAKVQDLANFKGGDRLFINLSDTEIGVKIGDTAVAVPVKKAAIYASPKLANPANMPIVYRFYHPEQKKWKLLTASTVVITPTRREICVFSNGSRIGKIKKHGILFPVQNEAP